MSHTPVLAAVVSDPDGGAVTAKFFARQAGTSGWGLADGAEVEVASGQVARFTLPAVSAGDEVQWTVQACDTVSCSDTAPERSDVVSGLLGAGQRKGATGLPFELGDRVQGRVDVGTGNLQVVATGLSAPGVNGDLPVSAVYNSLALRGENPQVQGPLGHGWTHTFSDQVRLLAQDDGSQVYIGPGGVSGTFVPTPGGFTAPAGMTVDLVHVSGTTYTLTDHASQQRLGFTDTVLTAVADRNGNQTTVSTSPLTVTGTAGPAAARAITATESGSRITELTQGATGGGSRSVTYGYDGAGDLVSVTDPAGRATTFTYDDHQLVQVVAPGGITTHFAYDDRARVTSVRQVNTAAGAPGDTWTRLAYPSTTEVLVSDGAQEQADSPTSGPRTTYTLTEDMTGRVSDVVDAEGREQSTTFTPNFDPETATIGTGTEASTTTGTYGANDGESLTGVTSPGGAGSAFGYDNTDDATRFLATSSTDDAGNQSLYTFNGAGNQLSTADAMGAQADLTYNPDGTVATATAPGNGTNATAYSYAEGRLTQVTPVSGSSLGVREATYDGFGRMATISNGAGVTTTYTYDALDRTTGMDYSTTTASPDVAFTYDTAGRTATRTDASGTTTYAYDDLGNLTSRTHSLDDVTVSYAYDKAARLAATSDARGTTSYDYDQGGALVAMNYEIGGQTRTTRFAIDDKGRRTNTWMDTNANNTDWSAHSGTEYDSSGRVTRVLGQYGYIRNGELSPVTVVDHNYCYAAGSTYPDCSMSAGDDRSLVQWMADEVTGQISTYTYDGANRLTGVDTTAGQDVENNPLPAVTHAYTYDPRGNRTTAVTTTGTGTEAVTSTQTREHNAANQTTTTGFSYDGAGNQLTDPEAGTITYTAGDQTASVTRDGDTYDYTYAGVGQNELVHQTTPEGDYTYTYGRTDQVGRPIIEQVQVDFQRAFVENDPTGQAVMLRSHSANQLLYVHDHLGSPIALIADSRFHAFGWKYDPFGAHQSIRDSGGTADEFAPHRFTAGTFDRSTGWIKNGARYYNPTEGRWTQHDTLDAPLDPANANRYAYAANNPINYIDPTGTVTLAEGLGYAATAVAVAGLAATGFGAPAAVSVGLSIAGTGLSVGSQAAAGDTQGAAVTAVIGATTAGFGVAASQLGVSSAAAFGVDLGYTGIASLASSS
ncbi:RHS repeat protein [Actinotalea sp. BY-33]|uniref:RHS repeat protein n=1 Tax=Actinotalea soli TaxID=2819234 RepID=A0A939LN22_9CELL|nr:RHS repeat-associated core domain-containing protein [Actinotalea soli]MBO1751317.1 RHS repeat protein [Actinotalea soli]